MARSRIFAAGAVCTLTRDRIMLLPRELEFKEGVEIVVCAEKNEKGTAFSVSIDYCPPEKAENSIKRQVTDVGLRPISNQVHDLLAGAFVAFGFAGGIELVMNYDQEDGVIKLHLRSGRDNQQFAEGEVFFDQLSHLFE